MKNNNIKVSVCVVTYNQESYIEKTILSILEQDCDFEYEILVGDDCSTDRTREVLLRIRDKYPDKISLYFRPNNIGAAKNIIDLYKRAKGIYISHLDGDDLMHSDKLMEQVVILDNNQDVVFCTHNVDLIDEMGNRVGNSFRVWPNGRHDLDSLLSQLPFFAHSSKVFRNMYEKSEYDLLNVENLIDIEIHFFQSQFGSIYHIDRVLGSYRVFTGVSSNSNHVNPLLPNATRRIFKQVLDREVCDRKIKKYKEYYAKAILAYSYQSALKGDGEMASKYAKESYLICRYTKHQYFFYILSFFPSLLVFSSKLIFRIKKAIS
ncbi:glycosyltransferase [Vibrio cidicii]|uniref:glycosyltransferase family 2 protein n=1 Tax=Vibrio cidicii TaxID=1763883 RepID=UPI003752973D